MFDAPLRGQLLRYDCIIADHSDRSEGVVFRPLAPAAGDKTLSGGLGSFLFFYFLTSSYSDRRAGR